MSRRIESGASVKTGYCRGTYKLLVEDVSSLKTNEVVRSPAFEMGGFMWRLALFRGYRNGNPPEMVRIFLFSCNDSGVHSHVSFTILYGGGKICQETERKPKTALPFHYIDKREILVDQLFDQSAQSEEGQFIVEVDLKNIRAAKEDELRPLRCNTRTVQVEVIDHETIIEALRKSRSSRVVLPRRRRNRDVCGASLVGLWAERDPDHRYSLCERAPNGKLVIKRCLNSAGLFERFEDVSDKSGGSFPWVTVFREDKKSNEEFRPIENTVMVLCLLSEVGYTDLSYLGHQLIQQTDSCIELSTAIAKMAEIHERCAYKVFAEGSLYATDITSKLSSLNECGVHSGCCAILRKSKATPCSRLELENNQQAIIETRESNQNDDDGGHVGNSSQNSDQQSSGDKIDAYEDFGVIARKHKVDIVDVWVGATKRICFVFAFFLILALSWVLSQNVDGLLEWSRKYLKWSRKQP